MKVALYGGSFNPPHYGHLWLAHWLASARPLGIQRVLVAPTVTHPFKKNLRPYGTRANWVRSHLAGSELDVQLFYAPEELTVDTVRRVMDFPSVSGVVTVLGIDLIQEVDRWEGWDELQRISEILFVGRKGFQVPEGIPFPVVQPDLPQISSTRIRSLVESGDRDELIRWVPAAIVDQILKEQT